MNRFFKVTILFDDSCGVYCFCDMIIKADTKDDAIKKATSHNDIKKASKIYHTIVTDITADIDAGFVHIGGGMLNHSNL